MRNPHVFHAALAGGAPAAALVALLAVAALSGCSSTGTLTPAAQTAITTACAQDAILQPKAVAAAGVVAGLAPVAGAPGVVAGTAVGVATGIDEAVIHPAIQDMCQKALTDITASAANPPVPVVVPVAAP
jgi:hypothetical protein